MDVGLATDVVIAHGVAMATVVAIAVACVTKAVPVVVTMLSVFSCAGVSVVWEGESVATAAVLSLQVAGSNCEYYRTRTKKSHIQTLVVQQAWPRVEAREGGGGKFAPPPTTTTTTIQTSVNFETLQSYVFARLRRIAFKFGSFTNFKASFPVVSTDFP